MPGRPHVFPGLSWGMFAVAVHRYATLSSIVGVDPHDPVKYRGRDTDIDGARF